MAWTPSQSEKADELPSDFDWRQAKPHCLSPVQKQGSCGSCYAFSTASMVADRHCIKTGGAHADALSVEFIISCDSIDFGCGGGHINNAIDFMSFQGVPPLGFHGDDSLEYVEKPLDYCFVDLDEWIDIEDETWLKC